MHASPAIVAGDFVFPSGMMASDGRNGLASEARPRPGLAFNEIPTKLQTRHIYRTLASLLEASGSDLDHIVRLDQFTLDRSITDPYIEARNEFLTKDRPASTAVPIARLPVADATVQVDSMAVLRDGLPRRIANAPDLPYNVGGGYSQAVVAGDWVFCAGAVASDHKGAGPYPGALGTGVAPEARGNPNYWYGSGIKLQTRYLMETKLAGVLKAAGSSVQNIVRAQAYFLDPARDYAGFLEVWRETFPTNPPSLTITQVGGFGTVGGLLELSLIALKNDSQIPRQAVSTDRAPKPTGHEPQALKVGPYLFISTQLAADENGLAAEAAVNPSYPFYEQAGEKEMTCILRNVEAICQAAGADLSCIVKSWTFHTQIADLASAHAVWREAFPKDPPANTIVGVNGPLQLPNCRVALDLVGYIPS
jgi:enamine deaminase RidA (YjgF/YER057c/UK114 family)